MTVIETNRIFPRYILDPTSSFLKTKIGEKLLGPSQPAQIVDAELSMEVINSIGEEEGSAVLDLIHNSYADHRAQLAAWTQMIPTVGIFLGINNAMLHGAGLVENAQNVTGLPTLLAIPGIETASAIVSVTLGRIGELLAKPLVDRLFRMYSQPHIEAYLKSEHIAQ